MKDRKVYQVLVEQQTKEIKKEQEKTSHLKTVREASSTRGWGFQMEEAETKNMKGRKNGAENEKGGRRNVREESGGGGSD